MCVTLAFSSNAAYAEALMELNLPLTILVLVTFQNIKQKL